MTTDLPPALGDDYFCLVMDERTGRPRLAPKVAGAGLGAALLAELVIIGAARVEGQEVAAVPGMVPEEPLAAQVHQVLQRQAHHRDLGIWIEYLARDAVHLVGARLAGRGFVTVTERRRLTKVTTTYLPTDSNAFAWPAVRIAQQLCGLDEVTLADLTCAGIAAASGLIGYLLWDPELHASGRAGLRATLGRLPEPLAALCARTESIVADAVLTNRA